MPGPETQPLFEEASRLGVGFHLGYAELTSEGKHFNTSILCRQRRPNSGEISQSASPGT